MNRIGEGQQKLPQEEILAILRAADGIIGRAGRSMLAKILKGSKYKPISALTYFVGVINTVIDVSASASGTSLALEVNACATLTAVPFAAPASK